MSLLEKSRDYIKALAGIDTGTVRRVTADSITFLYNADTVGYEFETLFAKITKALQVRGEKFINHNGMQATWDFDGKRVAIHERFYGDSEITLFNDMAE